MLETTVSHDAFIVRRALAFLKYYDFREDALAILSQGCTFPWLLANAVHAGGRLMRLQPKNISCSRRVDN